MRTTVIMLILTALLIGCEWDPRTKVGKVTREIAIGHYGLDLFGRKGFDSLFFEADGTCYHFGELPDGSDFSDTSTWTYFENERTVIVDIRNFNTMRPELSFGKQPLPRNVTIGLMPLWFESGIEMRVGYENLHLYYKKPPPQTGKKYR